MLCDIETCMMSVKSKISQYIFRTTTKADKTPLSRIAYLFNQWQCCTKPFFFSNMTRSGMPRCILLLEILPTSILEDFKAQLRNYSFSLLTGGISSRTDVDLLHVWRTVRKQYRKISGNSMQQSDLMTWSVEPMKLLLKADWGRCQRDIRWSNWRATTTRSEPISLQ